MRLFLYPPVSQKDIHVMQEMHAQKKSAHEGRFFRIQGLNYSMIVFMVKAEFSFLT